MCICARNGTIVPLFPSMMTVCVDISRMGSGLFTYRPSIHSSVRLLIYDVLAFLVVSLKLDTRLPEFHAQQGVHLIIYLL